MAYTFCHIRLLIEIVQAAIFAFFTAALAAPAELERRQSCVETCGSTCYWWSDITAALNKGYSLQSSGKEEDVSLYRESGQLRSSD